MSDVAAQAAPATAADDARYMDMALSLGRRGLGNTWPNPAVGAVIVKDGVVIARGWTQPGGRPHAEVEALRRARKAAQGATLYATLEPCSHEGKSPPCADAIIRAGIARVVSAMEDPNPEVAGLGHERLRAKGIAVEVGLGAEDARRAHIGHITRLEKSRPHVLLKLALSSDGKVGLAGRKLVALSGEQARERVFRMRAQSDAILVGIGTVLSDNPHLTCRLPGMEERSPVRVVLDSQLRLPLSTSVVATVREAPTWVFTSGNPSAIAEDILRQKGAQVFRVGERNGQLDLGEVLKVLGQQSITRLMVEGGPKVAASLVAADLVDEAVLVRTDKNIGAGIDALEGMPLSALTNGLRPVGREKLGNDIIETYERG
jgi:diaminohydroxyphosphoribosylaminopyrimidine deaminase/5-amino-6-(5-phosphoribosylamino)uracil reductase